MKERCCQLLWTTLRNTKWFTLGTHQICSVHPDDDTELVAMGYN